MWARWLMGRFGNWPIHALCALALVWMAGSAVAQQDGSASLPLNFRQVWHPGSAMVVERAWRNTQLGRRDYLVLEFRDRTGLFHSVEHPVSREVYVTPKVPARRTIWYDPADHSRVAIAEDKERAMSVADQADESEWGREKDGKLSALATVQSRSAKRFGAQKSFYLKVKFQDRRRAHHTVDLEVPEGVYMSKPRMSFIKVWYDPKQPKTVELQDLNPVADDAAFDRPKTPETTVVREVLWGIFALLSSLSIYVTFWMSSRRQNAVGLLQAKQDIIDGKLTFGVTGPFNVGWMVFKRGGFLAIYPLICLVYVAVAWASFEPRVWTGTPGYAVVEDVFDGQPFGIERFSMLLNGLGPLAAFRDQRVVVDQEDIQGIAVGAVIEVFVTTQPSQGQPPQDMKLIDDLGSVHRADIQTQHLLKWQALVLFVGLAVIFGFATHGLAADLRCRDHGRLIYGRIEWKGQSRTLEMLIGRHMFQRLEWSDFESRQLRYTRFHFIDGLALYRSGDRVRAYKLGKHVVWEGDVGSAPMSPSSIPKVRG